MTSNPDVYARFISIQGATASFFYPELYVTIDQNYSTAITTVEQRLQ